MRAKLFRNGRSQAVRLPAACRFEGSEVEVQHDPRTGAVTLTPVRSSPLAWLRRGERFDSVMRMGAGALSVLLGVVMAIERLRDR
jgi:antitoxin VapB